MKRNYAFDLMRIYLCLSVITIHASGYFAFEDNTFRIIFLTFLFQSNCMFYMISGYYNLDREFKDSTDIKKFYKGRIIKTLLPFVLFVLFWTVWEYTHATESFNFLELLGICYDSIMASSCNTHLWFLYPLFGLLISTPFLSKMVHNMSDKELKLLWRIIIGFNVVGLYLCDNFGVGFRVSAMFLDGWYLYYFGGYYYKRIISKESNTKWIILGVAGYVLTVIGRLFLDRFESATDIATLFALFCIACFLFWDKAVHIKNEKIIKVISFISRYTFYIYLYHMRAIEFLQPRIDSLLGTGNTISSILLVLSSFVVSLIASIATDLLLKPLQKAIDKVWVIK